jgi:ABC-type polysaccharide/polyol phosphate export permease
MSQSPSRVAEPHTDIARLPEPAGPPPDYVEKKVQVFIPTRRRVRLREFVTSFSVGSLIAMRDIKVKYKQSALGPLWLVMQPLGMLVALVVAFSAVADVDTGGVPYTVFALLGLAVWNYFTMGLNSATAILPSNGPLVRRSVCPRLALVTASLIGSLPPFLILMPISVIAAAATIGLPIQALLLPAVIAWLFVFTLGMTLSVSALSGRFRDMVAFAPMIVTAGIFLTPVGYPLDVAGGASWVIALNPVSGLLEAWRWCALGVSPDLFAVGAAGVWTVGLLLLGWYIFGRMEPRFADYV